MLEITLFGTLSLHYDGQPVTRFPGKRVKDLLSYLLLNREAMHSREHVAGLLWPDLDDRKARHCLNTTLWRLNQVLAQPGQRAHPYLRIDAETIGFNTASDFRLDVAEFDSCFTLAREIGAQSPGRQAALYRQAVDLYQADLLVDCYDDWCILERERFVRLYSRALDQLVAYHSGRGEHSVAIEYAHHLLSCDPLREEVHRDLIQLYLATDQPTTALQQYRTCEEIVRRELGMEPMPETRALLPRILESYDARVLPERRESVRAARADISRGLDDVLAGLQQAFSTFHTAYAQLLDVVQTVQEVADGAAADAREPSSSETVRTVVSQLRDNHALAVETGQRLARMTERESA